MSDWADYRARHPATTHLDALVFDVSGRAIGKRLPLAQADKPWDAGMRMPGSNLMYDARGRSHGVMGLGVTDGDPDAAAHAVAGTLAAVPWSAGGAQVLVALVDADGPLWHDPRAILGAAVARLGALGLTAVVACELEFYLVERDAQGRLSPARPPCGPVSPGECYRFDKLDTYAPLLAAIDAALVAQGLPAGAASAEYGTTQFEINLDHVADAVRAADLASLQKRAIAGAARAAGADATFMAKPFADQAGSGLHVHLSLVDAAGNIFDDRRVDGDVRLGHAIGGLRAQLFDMVAVFAPSLNSYRRFRPGLFAPLNASWGHENRTVALRVPAERGGGSRIEHRVAGADANPYLVLAALLHGVADGIERELDPGPPATGDAGRAADADFPRTLWRALDRFAASAAAATAFGRFRDAYVELKMREAEAMIDDGLAIEQAWLA